MKHPAAFLNAVAIKFNKLHGLKPFLGS